MLDQLKHAVRGPRGSQRGFTLIELVVTLAVVAILATIATPSIRSFMVNKQLSSVSSEFLISLMQARAEALRLGRPVVVAPVNEGSTWTNGWQIFVDNDGSGKLTTSNAASQTLIASAMVPVSGVADGAWSNVSVSGSQTSGSFSCTSNPYYSYAPSGFPKVYASLCSTTATVSSLWFRAASTNRSRVVVVQNSGRPRICDPSTDGGNNCTN